MLFKRKSDDKDSSIAVVLNYIGAFLIALGVFLTDWVFDKGILDGALIGVLISKAFDWITKMNEYYFPTNRGSKIPPEERQTPTEQPTTERTANDETKV